MTIKPKQWNDKTGRSGNYIWPAVNKIAYAEREYWNERLLHCAWAYKDRRLCVNNDDRPLTVSLYVKQFNPNNSGNNRGLPVVSYWFTNCDSERLIWAMRRRIATLGDINTKRYLTQLTKNNVFLYTCTPNVFAIVLQFLVQWCLFLYELVNGKFCFCIV